MPRKRITAPPKPLDLSNRPDDAHIRTHEVARMTGYAAEYIRKKAKKDPTFPQPVGRTGDGPNGPIWFRIGDIRRYLEERGKQRAKK